MKTTLIRSERVRKRIQLGVMPVAAGLVIQDGGVWLIETAGVAAALAILVVLIVVQVYLIVARLRFDMTGRAF